MSGTRDPVDTDFAGDDAAVIHAAARHLRVSEYDLFKLAYDKWWGRAPADKELEPVFVSFLYHHDTPHWARHFARDVLRRARDGTLDRDAMGAGEYRRVVPFVPRRHGPAKATVALVAAYVALASLIYYKTEIGHALCRALDRDGVMGGVASVLVARDSEFCRQARRRKPADEPISEEAARR